MLVEEIEMLGYFYCKLEQKWSYEYLQANIFSQKRFADFFYLKLLCRNLSRPQPPKQSKSVYELIRPFSNAETYPRVFNVKSHHTSDKTWWKKKNDGCSTKSNYPWKRTLYTIARHRELTPLFILFPGLFEIIVQSTLGTAIPFY